MIKEVSTGSAAFAGGVRVSQNSPVRAAKNVPPPGLGSGTTLCVWIGTKVTTPTACVETVNPILVAPVGKEKFVGEEAVAKGLALNT